LTPTLLKGLRRTLACAVWVTMGFLAGGVRAESVPSPESSAATVPSDASSSPASAETPVAEKVSAATPEEPTPEEAPETLLWREIPSVVSASRREEPASLAPNAVSIITADDIRRSGMMNLGDLLRLAVGVDVGQLDNANYAVSVRGMNGRYSKKTLVMIDGRTVYDTVFGGVFWWVQPILLEDIDRIEVVRGPGGAAWGANAANGVINIITKKPSDTPGGLIQTTLTNRGDSLSTFRYGLTAGKLDLRLTGGYDSLQEVDAHNAPADHDRVRMPRFQLRGTYHFNEEDSLDVDFGGVEGLTGYAGTGAFPDGRDIERSRFVRARYTHQEAPDDLWYFQYSLNWSKYAIENSAWSKNIINDVEIQRVRPLGDSHVLTYGGNVRQDNVTVGDRINAALIGLPPGDTRTTWGGVFVQDAWKLHPMLTFVNSVRADHNSYTDWEWAGRTALLIHPVAEHVFRLSAARAYRTPSLSDRNLGNALAEAIKSDVAPAYISAYEFGYTYEGRPVRLNAEFFWNDYRGIIAQHTWGGARVSDNLVDGDLYGFELKADWQVTHRLRLDASYVWELWSQSGSLARGAVPLTSSGVALPPRNKVGLGACYEPVEGLTLNGRMFYVDGVTYAMNQPQIPSWVRFDFSVAKTLGKNCEIAVGILNAFDGTHPEFSGMFGMTQETAPRTVYCQFLARF